LQEIHHSGYLKVHRFGAPARNRTPFVGLQDRRIAVNASGAI